MNISALKLTIERGLFEEQLHHGDFIIAVKNEKSKCK